MPKTTWPDDHPNTKIQLFIESCRQVISRVPPTPLAEAMTKRLAELEALVDQQYTARTRTEIEQLVSRVVPLVNEAVAQMEPIRAQLQQLQEARKKAGGPG